ncbi:MAG TPA: DUF4230 domain-containing protein [Kineosporiaceae bacterium]|nr:DUF4230 domain-containing protein [Kineosporiaceae bacterium]
MERGRSTGPGDLEDGMGADDTTVATRPGTAPGTDLDTRPLPAVPEEAPLEVDPPAGPVAPAARRPVPRTVWFFVVIAVLVVAMGLATSFVIRALGDANPFKNGIVTNQTIDRSGPAVLKAVNDLGRFQAASGHYEVIVDIEHNTEHVPSWLSGRRVLFVAAGDVDVAVDLAGLGSGAVTVDQTRTSATITLPKPQLAPARLDIGKSYVYSDEQGFVDRLRGGDAGDMQEVYAAATNKLDTAAKQSGELTTRAEANTRSMLQGLLKSLGFTNVTVTFR